MALSTVAAPHNCKIWYLTFWAVSEDDAHRGNLDDRSVSRPCRRAPMRRWSLTTWRATEQILAVVSGIPFVRKRCPCVLPVQFRHLLRHNPLPKSQLGSRRRFPRRRLNGRQLCRACCGQRASSGRRARTETHARMVPACAGAACGAVPKSRAPPCWSRCLCHSRNASR